MKEGILHVKLVDRLGTRSSKAEDDAYRGRLDNGAECFVVVDAVALREAANHPTCLVADKGTIRVEFVFKNPLARHNIGARRTKDEALGPVINERLVLVSHSSPPLRVGQGTPVIRRYQQDDEVGGGEAVALDRTKSADL